MSVEVNLLSITSAAAEKTTNVGDQDARKTRRRVIRRGDHRIVVEANKI